MKKILYLSLVAVLGVANVDMAYGSVPAAKGDEEASAAKRPREEAAFQSVAEREDEVEESAAKHARTDIMVVTDEQFARLRTIYLSFPEALDHELVKYYMEKAVSGSGYILPDEVGGFKAILDDERYSGVSSKDMKVSLSDYLIMLKGDDKWIISPKLQDSVKNYLLGDEASLSPSRIQQVKELVKAIERDREDFSFSDYESDKEDDGAEKSDSSVAEPVASASVDPIDQALADLGNQVYSIQDVNVSNLPLGDEGVKTMIILLKDARKVRSMDVSNCDITDTGAAALLKFIKSHPTVKEVKLTGNNIFDNEIMEQITAACKKNQKQNRK